MKKLTTVFIAIISLGLLQAQTTGSFQESVTFDEPDYSFTRILYYYVPSDYDPSISYKLVVGFRGGPNSNAGQFRDQLTFLSDELGAIILCPENSDHFWNNEGLTKQLFQYSFETVSETYNIDSDFIYLTGLSYGGRHSVIVSMDTDNGAIPNLRGVIPFATGSEGDLQPNYDSIDEFAPACICIGLDDSSNFIAVANNLHDDILLNGGSSFLNEIPDVGHTVDFPSFEAEMMECINFIEGQYATSVDEVQLKIEQSIRVYPNPSNNILNVDIPEELKIEGVHIEDLSGKIVVPGSLSDRSFDVSSLAIGQYNLILVGDGNRIVKKFSISQ
ncbi:MAG: hypothetical protein ACI8U0_000900 [Flavobacteriales bacterium]|jgi:hypothetical protein